MDAGDLGAWPLLAKLTGPADIRGLDPDEVAELCAQIRDFLIQKVCATGGHLGGNLGVVELTVALHRAFDSPRDVLIFDTGHQTYVHKILTGRGADFGGLRQAGGLSGYPSRGESPHDTVENSHASTALSYADGLAKAFQLRGEEGRRVVAVIGDGGMTGGLAWEGLNNLSVPGSGRPVVVLNDNGRSYDATIGGLAAHLAALRRTRPEDSSAAGPSPAPRWVANTVFEHLGLAYIGPVDGHDVAALESAFDHACSLGRPVLVHVVTAKGKGYGPAETDAADRMHGIGVLDPATGAAAPGKPTWTDVFGDEIVRIGERRPDVVCVTAAMTNPVGLGPFARTFPDRVFDVGIAEQHAVCSAAGLAMGGLHPVVCLYATFLNRAFDQVLMDVALQRQPVTFVLDRAGITGPDGASHHGMWDTGILSVVPGLRVAAPRDPASLRELLDEAVADDGGPTVIRYPKATAGSDIPAIARVDGLDIVYSSGTTSPEVLLVAAGAMAGPCLAAAALLHGSGIETTVVDPRWITPISQALIELAARHRVVVTVEDAARSGGMGALLVEACADVDVPTPVLSLGLPRAFIDHGGRGDLLAQHGLTAERIAAAAARLLARPSAEAGDPAHE
ncbi:1-deoxy-D-xylulose-5-phosphate synthase [Rhodococcus sp. PvR099]|nr:1-deoxy-D-xylulose-5-phosphate synthase [Rhodococcus maanshanensis]MBP1160396.1 1-deoxy-D-xylulose-5-phosphate synthase [Rhodococcus sp. PvR099]MCZ4556132.1 1-deoxy-D-xylulose-5-phosphate synthase [Rhodococcus maanshanensis]